MTAASLSFSTGLNPTPKQAWQGTVFCRAFACSPGPPLELPQLPARQYGLRHPFGVPDVSGKQKTPCVNERTTPPFGSTIAPVHAFE